MPYTDLSKRLAQKSHRLVLTTHWNPDGDAIGASLGLAHYLRGQGHSVEVVLPNTPSATLQNTPGYAAAFVHCYADNTAKADAIFAASEGLLSLDYNTASRVGESMQSKIELFEGFKVLIDHHQSPDTGYDYIVSQTTKSSTAEMVYDFIAADGGALDVAAADCLMTGLITDTGSFRFPSVQPATLAAASALMTAGAEPYRIHERLFDANPVSRLKLWGRGLTSLEILAGGKATLVHLKAEDLQVCGYVPGDTEGLVNQGLSLEGVSVSVFAREDQEGQVKLSFRSKGSVDVNAFARQHWQGGGHVHAAGGRSDLDLEATLTALRSTLSTWLAV